MIYHNNHYYLHYEKNEDRKWHVLYASMLLKGGEANIFKFSYLFMKNIWKIA